jgi:hypothetical protein
VDMWTTQERCPHAHSDNNRRKQLVKMKQTNNHPLDCAMSSSYQHRLQAYRQTIVGRGIRLFADASPFQARFQFRGIIPSRPCGHRIKLVPVPVLSGFVLALREQFADDGKRVYFGDLGLEIVPQLREKRENHPDFVGMWQACWGAACRMCPAHCGRMAAQAPLAGVRKDDKP